MNVVSYVASYRKRLLLILFFKLVYKVLMEYVFFCHNITRGKVANIRHTIARAKVALIIYGLTGYKAYLFYPFFPPSFTPKLTQIPQNCIDNLFLHITLRPQLLQFISIFISTIFSFVITTTFNKNTVFV